MKKNKRGKGEGDDENIEDPRFKAAETHPQFRSRPKRSENELVGGGGAKVVIDERFASVLTDADRFGGVAPKDKRGKKQRKNKRGNEDMSAFYTLDDNRFDVSKLEEKKKTKSKKEKEESSEDEEEKDEIGLGPDETPASRIAYLNALSRGELNISSSSSSESDDDDDSSDGDQDSDGDDEEDDEETAVYGKAGILDPSSNDAMGAGEEELDDTPSPYLAVMGMDWEFVRAADLFSIFSSFTAPGAVKEVRVFPSDFGLERMEQDRLSGPSGLWKKQKSAEKKKQNEAENEDDESESDEENNSDGDDNSEAPSEEDNEMPVGLNFESGEVETDYDVEKVRAYEASKLRYYFAIVTFSSTEHADMAYKQIDGMEFEHSSSKMDLRTLPPENLDETIKDRPIRDEASSIPHNYTPPEFVVTALQQTNVECTWDMGDPNRQRALTKYSKTGWGAAKDAKDSDSEDEDAELRAYIASENSSAGESSDEEDSDSDEDSVGGKKNQKKASSIRKMLGLDGDEDEDEGDESNDGGSDSSDDDDALVRNLKRKSKDGNMSKTFTFVPGESKQLEEKIRSKLAAKDEEPAKELTPWEKYKEKRKQKKKERRQAARGRKHDEESDSEPPAKSGKSKRKSKRDDDDDAFFSNGADDDDDPVFDKEKSKAELELLLAGNDEEERAKDFDIRGLQKLEKTKDKKLRGSSKRKRAKLESSLPGADFQVDTKDNRFAAVLDGSDDRFGIDMTNPSFKSTPAMKEILKEQTQRRKKRRKNKQGSGPQAVKNVNADESTGQSAGAAALSSLVMKIKSRVK